MADITLPDLSLTAKTPGIAALVQFGQFHDGQAFFSVDAPQRAPNFCHMGPLYMWSGNDNHSTIEPTDNRGVWAGKKAMRGALDRLGLAIGQTVDMHRSGRTWRLRHGLMDLPERQSFWHALRAGLEEIAEVVAFDEPWAKPELLDALSEAYEAAGGKWWRILPKEPG